MPTGITVHFRVKNEENYCEAALRAVLPLAERVIVFDTASTDQTLEKIRSIHDSRIEIHEVPATDAQGLCEYRNQMAEMTKTEWYMIVDGDEIYPPECVGKIRERMKGVPENIDRIKIYRKHFYKNLNFISGLDGLGRIFRTETVRRTLHPTATNKVGHETPHVVYDPKKDLKDCSLNFPEDIFFFHFHYLPRSSRQADMGKMRGWRNPPFPVRPYFGPWPAAMRGDARKMTLKIALQCILLNFWNLAAIGKIQASKISKAV